MLVKIEARILIFPGTDFHFPSTSVPPGTFLRLCSNVDFLPRDTMLARYLPSSCPPVCPSVRSQYCIKTTGRIELVLARMLPSAYPTLCYKEMYLQKLGYFPRQLFVLNSGHRKFRHGKSIALSTKLVVVVVVDGRAC